MKDAGCPGRNHSDNFLLRVCKKPMAALGIGHWYSFYVLLKYCSHLFISSWKNPFTVSRWLFLWKGNSFVPYRLVKDSHQEGTGLGFHTETITQEIAISSYVLSEDLCFRLYVKKIWKKKSTLSIFYHIKCRGSLGWNKKRPTLLTANEEKYEFHFCGGRETCKWDESAAVHLHFFYFVLKWKRVHKAVWMWRVLRKYQWEGSLLRRLLEKAFPWLANYRSRILSSGTALVKQRLCHCSAKTYILIRC